MERLSNMYQRPSFQSANRYGPRADMAGQNFNHNMLISSREGAQVLDRLVQNFKSRNTGSESYPKKKVVEKEVVRPDPVLWFPGGDADCGGSAGGGGDISAFSLIAVLLSVFNIIDLLVTNANNNNNRNNINDNAQNQNINSNTESNANPDQASANQVMLVPPGVGRRKRETRHNQTALFMELQILNNSRISLNLFDKDDISFNNISTEAVSFNRSREEIIDELGLGVGMVLNSWHLYKSGVLHCQHRNTCELGFNGAVWGDVSSLLTEFSGKIIARWFTDSVESEKKMLDSLKKGLLSARRFRWDLGDDNLLDDEEIDGDHASTCDQHLEYTSCPVWIWNIIVKAAKTNIDHSD